MNPDQRFGFIGIAGRPNVGKSTLLNHLLAKKISVTSRKPHTTRCRIIGVKTMDTVQIAYVDSPGFNQQIKFKGHRYLNRRAYAALQAVTAVLLVVDASAWRPEDSWVLEQLKEINTCIILVVNKIDRLSSRDALLPFLVKAGQRFTFKAIVPVSAKRGDQLSTLEKEVSACLPQAPHGFLSDECTDTSDSLMASEFLREKLFRYLGAELPYAVYVTIESFEEKVNLIKISAIIWVERTSHKPIVIGKSGQRLKRILTQARCSMETYFEKKVFLSAWVKLRAVDQTGFAS